MGVIRTEGSPLAPGVKSGQKMGQPSNGLVDQNDKGTSDKASN